MIPCHKINLVDDGLDRLTSAYKGKSNTEKLVTIFLRRAQELEDETWKVITSRLLGSTYANVMYDDGECCDCDVDTSSAEEAEVILDAEDAHLDTIGATVGEPRNFRSDVEYLVAIRARILVNKSGGRAVQLLEIARRSVPPTTEVKYEEFYPARFQITALNAPGHKSAVKALGLARQGGVYGVLRSSSWPNDEPGNFVFGSVHGTVEGARALGSVHSAEPYSVLISAQECKP